MLNNDVSKLAINCLMTLKPLRVHSRRHVHLSNMEKSRFKGFSAVVTLTLSYMRPQNSNYTLFSLSNDKAEVLVSVVLLNNILKALFKLVMHIRCLVADFAFPIRGTCIFRWYILIRKKTWSGRIDICGFFLGSQHVFVKSKRVQMCKKSCFDSSLLIEIKTWSSLLLTMWIWELILWWIKETALTSVFTLFNIISNWTSQHSTALTLLNVISNWESQHNLRLDTVAYVNNVI